MIKTLNEDTYAAASLQPKSRPFDDFEADVQQAIDNFQRLNAKQKERYLGMVQQMMADAGTGDGTFRASLHEPYRDGAGVPDGAAAKNRRFNKGEREEGFDWPSVSEFLIQDELQDQLAEIGFNETAQEACKQLFEEAVGERLASDPFRQSVLEAMADCTINPFISDSNLDVVQLLADRIQQLEAQIEMVEAESQQLVSEIQDMLPEESNPSNSSRTPRRSTVNDFLCESDESDVDALYNQEQQVGSHQMQQYLRYFGRE